MKLVYVFLISVITFTMMNTQAFAGTAACHKMATAAAHKKLNKDISDDCFLKFVNASKADPNLINVGFFCDHVGGFLYRVQTEPSGNSCAIKGISDYETF